MTDILSSALIAAFITAIFTYFTHNRDSKLLRITDDRKTWRIEMRKIAQEINCSSVERINTVLVCLKLNINAFGQFNNQNFLQDGHIWKIIKDIENDSEGKNISNNKDKLITCISYLLKYDWERSKKEVIGNKSAIVTLISGAASYFLFCISYYDYFIIAFPYSELDEFWKKTILFLCLIIGIMLVPYTYSILDISSFHKKTDSYLLTKTILLTLVIVVSILFGAAFYMSCTQAFGQDSSSYYVSIPVLFSLIFSIWQSIYYLKQDYNYCNHLKIIIDANIEDKKMD